MLRRDRFRSQIASRGAITPRAIERPSVRARTVAALLILALPVPAACAPGSGTLPNDQRAVSIPLTVSQNPHFGTYSAQLSVALGNGRPLTFGFDTGSSGLHVFADAHLESTDGVRCSQTPTSVTYGNPPRITFLGVVCYAQLHFAGFATPRAVPVAYLTSAVCSATNPDCRVPDLLSPKAMHGYGVFGAGLTGIMSGQGHVPNPILTLPGRRGSVYNVILAHDGGRLVLGANESAGAAEFNLAPGTRPGERYSLPRACLFVDGGATGVCMLASFDTGNGVPWIHAFRLGAIPQRNGFVAPGTRLGFAPPGESHEATSVVAGTTFADEIRVIAIPNKPPLSNVSIQSFFGHIVTYDNERGVIAVAPAR